MTIDQLVGDALRAADDYDPSPDLFAKVQRSIGEDVAHRRRVRNVLLAVGGAVGIIAIYVFLTVDVAPGTEARAFTDRVTMPFVALEILVTVVMVGLVVVLGPMIRRFGETYERDVFRSNAGTGESVLRLLDIAYYLIFGAYVVMTLVYDPALEFGGTLPDWVRGELGRVAGLLLLMGVLHVMLLVALPVAGLVHSANERRRRISNGAVPHDALADRIDRYITVAAWVVGLVVVGDLVIAVIGLVLGGMSG